MANFGPSKTWTDGEILSHTDLNAALLDIINNVTNNNIDADNIDETDDYTWSGANSYTGGHSIKVLSNAASSIVTGTTLEWDPGDGGQMTDNSSGISLDFKLPDSADNQDVFASIAAICLDDTSTSEDGELSFRVATAGTNTEQMTLSNSALTVTPAITASGGITGSVTSSNATITGGSITGITDIAIADGGTGASTAAAARTNLGLEIGVDVQAYDAELQALSGLTPTDSNIIVGNGSTFVTESGATARTSLGLGSIATQSASAVSITGGSLTGMTSYSGGTISGTTGTFSGATTVGSAGATADFAVWTDGTSSTAAGFTVDASADEVIVGQLSGGGNTTFKVRNRLNNTVFSVTPDAPSTTVFAPNIATGSAGTLTVKTGSINSDSIRLEAGGTTSTWLESRGYLGHSWYVDSTRSMTLDSTGLGVGTDSAGEKLTVVGGGSTSSTANFTGGAAANDNATLASDYSMYYQIDANNTVGGRIFNWRVGGKGYSDGTSLLTLNASGNMGLGVTPNTYNSAHRALELGSRGANIAGRTDSDTIYVNANAYQHTDGNWKYDSTDEASQYYQTGGTHNWRRAASGTAGTNITWTTQAVLDATGLGIGTSSPACRTHIRESTLSGFTPDSNTNLAVEENSTSMIEIAGTDSGILFSDASAWAGRIFYTHSSDQMAFATAQSNKMIIDSSGNLLVGYTSSNGSYLLQVNSQIFATNATIATSDGRYKEDVQTLSNATDLVTRLNPVQFRWKAHETHNFDVGKTDVGFIAQEVQAVLSDTDYSDSVVVTNKTDDEEFLGLGETKLIPLLTAALQEAITKIETLETKVAALEAA